MTYQFNTETIAPSHVKCNRTTSSRAELAAQIEAAMANCKIKPQVVPGFAGVAPRPKRTAWVDPESRLKRKGITREERKQLRAMIDQMGGVVMKTDRELLELAAKAAGLLYVKPTEDYDGSMGLEVGSENPMRCFTWDPLQDSTNALWLAVKLRIDVCFGDEYVTARGSHSMPIIAGDHNPYAATRRAIVRAAAAIGGPCNEHLLVACNPSSLLGIGGVYLLFPA